MDMHRKLSLRKYTSGGAASNTGSISKILPSPMASDVKRKSNETSSSEGKRFSDTLKNLFSRNDTLFGENKIGKWSQATLIWLTVIVSNFRGERGGTWRLRAPCRLFLQGPAKYNRRGGRRVGVRGANFAGYGRYRTYWSQNIPLEQRWAIKSNLTATYVK